MSEENLTTSPFKRFVKLTGMVGVVSTSMLVEKATSIFRSELSNKAYKVKNVAQNARRIFDTLGKLKGAAMKAGQMLSLYEGLLPPEFLEIISKLQNEAPSVPFEVMQEEVQSELKEQYKLFKYIDPLPYASASIGQVHKAELEDGRKVVVKIQYPAIDHIIKTDLKHLKVLLSALFSMLTKIDVNPVWEELKEKLLEELDYRREAKQLLYMKKLHENIPEIVIPSVIPEVSGQRVLTMEFVEGISPLEACKEDYPSELRSRWGQNLWENAIRGILQFRCLHADPNFANFSFLEDGRVIVYDFGCIKIVPQNLAVGYAKLIYAILDDQIDTMPAILEEMNILKNDGSRIPVSVLEKYADFFKVVFRKSPPYTFGEDKNFFSNLFRIVNASWSETSDITFPQDVVFVDRTMSGHLGNLRKLKACAPWGEIIRKYADIAIEQKDQPDNFDIFE